MADPTDAERQKLAKMGVAMPDGSYYIRNSSDLANAIKAVGRGNASHDTIRKHCIQRAHALGLDSMIPENWNADGSLKHWDLDSYFAHFGVKGMHWGVRKDQSSSSGPSSADHQETARIKAKVQTHGLRSLSNDELKKLNERLNLEANHNRLNETTPSQRQAIENFLKSAARSEANKFIALYTAKGTAAAIKWIALNTAKSVGKHALG